MTCTNLVVIVAMGSFGLGAFVTIITMHAVNVIENWRRQQQDQGD